MKKIKEIMGILCYPIILLVAEFVVGFCGLSLAFAGVLRLL